MSDETPVVELNPVQAMLLYRAYYSEQARIRHEAEYWASQAGRDERNREMLMQQVRDSGVPDGQVDRFVYWVLTE